MSNPANIRALIYVSTLQTMFDALGVCYFVAFGIPLHQASKIVRGSLGVLLTTMFVPQLALWLPDIVFGLK